MMVLSVIIPTWNRRALLGDCLASILAHTQGLEYELIVVDNGSSDGTAGMIERDFPSVRLIRNDTNRGFTAACNEGMRRAQGRYLALVNNDTLFRENALGRLVSFLDVHPRAGVVGPLLQNPDGSVQRSALEEFLNPKTALLGGEFLAKIVRRVSPRAADRFPGTVVSPDQAREPREVAWVVGACMVVRREAVLQAGGLDENIFMYAEDMEWCYRLKQAGWSVWYDPAASVVHLDDLATKDDAERIVSRNMAHQIYFYRKHKGAVPALGLGLSLFLGSWMKLPGFLLGYGASRALHGRADPYLGFKVRYHYLALRYFFLLPFRRKGDV